MSTETLRRLSRLLWIQVAAAKNPWFDVAASEVSGSAVHATLWENWNRAQITITRALFTIVFKKVDPTEGILSEALDFLDGRPAPVVG